MSQLTLPCPAKLNLFLEVRGKRADGYHELGTLFQAVEFGDTLSAELGDKNEVICDQIIPGAPEDNLVYKATALLQKRYADRIKRNSGIRFQLTKRIPTGAGLGGGSSDAATALRLGNTLFELELSQQELSVLASELGSDVPFFLSHTTAFAEGRGELLTQARDPFPFHVVIATPKNHVETVWAYRQLQGKSFGTRWEKFKSGYSLSAQEENFYSELHNDFEEPIVAHFEEIRRIRGILNSFNPVKTLLTGSGASLFALFKQKSQAQLCLDSVASDCRFSILTHFKTGGFI